MIFTRTFFLSSKYQHHLKQELKIPTTVGKVFMVDREEKEKIYELSVFF